MFTKKLIVGAVLVLALGTTTIAFAKENREFSNGYTQDFSDEDYQRMIDNMKENGYGNMASMMESIGKDGMISMHNAMGDTAGCH